MVKAGLHALDAMEAVDVHTVMVRDTQKVIVMVLIHGEKKGHVFFAKEGVFVLAAMAAHKLNASLAMVQE